MSLLLASLLAAVPSLFSAGVMTMPSDAGSARKKERKTAAAKAGGDVQVGPDVEPPAAEPPPRRPRKANAKPRLPGAVERLAPPSGQSKPSSAAKPAARSQNVSVPGIYPVYPAGGRWMLVDRQKGKRRAAGKGSEFVVIGSRGAGLFHASASTRTWIAACSGHSPAPTPGLILKSKKATDFARVGTPIIAILIKPGVAFDVSRAWFYPLKNELDEAAYRRLEGPAREAVLEDLATGDYQILPDDEEGHRLARSPNPEKVQLKLEFGSQVRIKGLKDAFLAVEGTLASQTHRRCMRLFGGEKPVGGCAEMPHALMQETKLLKFVAYDPSRRGVPFVLAYSEEDPLWGHERWGFQLTQKGPKLFMRDALDPRCREAF